MRKSTSGSSTSKWKRLPLPEEKEEEEEEEEDGGQGGSGREEDKVALEKEATGKEKVEE